MPISHAEYSNLFTENPMSLFPLNRLTLGLALAGFTGLVHAAGFALVEQNASGLGNAYAGSAAVAENASTVFYNPAGMTQLQAHEFSVGISLLKPSFRFQDQGSSVGALAGTGNSGDGGTLGVLPNAYLSYALNKDVYLGLGVGAPFGLMTEYDAPWLGAAQSVSFDVKTYNVNPSLAYRLNDKISLGVGLNWQRIEADYVRRVAVSTALAAATPLTLTLDDNSWGWNVGALFTLSPATKFGVSYRSAVKHDLTGKIDVAAPLEANGSNAKADLKLPDMLILSVTQQVSDRWQVLGDLSWTGWSTIPKIDVVRTSGAGTGTIAQTLDSDFRDTWRIALGGTYKYSDNTRVKLGVAYDQTPVKGATTRLVSLPDNNRLWLSLGAQWQESKSATLDIGGAYLYIKDAEIDNNQTLQGRGRVTGTFEDSAWLFGAQYSMAF
jgi:long-chain fatty acid transport protein